MAKKMVKIQAFWLNFYNTNEKLIVGYMVS